MDARELKVDGWERVVHFVDDEAGLNAIISIHDTTLGAGCGGCRVRPYGSIDEALEDVTRLSRGMTYKNALGGIPFGGGKAVIIADPRKDKTPEMFKSFGKAIQFLGGDYYTAEDSGVSEEDLKNAQQETNFVAGIEARGIGGNPSPFTARGVWRGMQAAARHKFGQESLKGLSVSILGIGAVGMALAELLHKEGADLIVADVNEAALDEAKSRFGAHVVQPKDACAANVDIFSPCALGGAVNGQTIDRINAKIIAGAANNQLLRPELDGILQEKGILYAPDYVINAAGVISVGLEILGDWSSDELERRIDKIGETLTIIFSRAKEESRPTGEVADQMALKLLDTAGKQRKPGHSG